jgi:hypothetical protein
MVTAVYDNASMSPWPLLLFLVPAQTVDPLFREDFERFDRSRWDDLGRTPGALEVVEGGYGGGKCARIRATLGENTGAHLYKMLDPGLETCHLRFYVKFEKDHGYVHHFVHLVGYSPPTRYPQGGAGERPEGDERFSTGIEPWGLWGKHPPPGAWHFYSYWCEMKGSRDGKFWGNSFSPEEPVLVETDRWICVEIMVKVNSDTEMADGEQAFWIDGKKMGHWKDIRWRKDDKLKVNGLWMLYYITENAPRQNRVKDPRKTNTVYFDEIVVSRSYIGPIQDSGSRRKNSTSKP